MRAYLGSPEEHRKASQAGLGALRGASCAKEVLRIQNLGNSQTDGLFFREVMDPMGAELGSLGERWKPSWEP